MKSTLRLFGIGILFSIQFSSSLRAQHLEDTSVVQTTSNSAIRANMASSPSITAVGLPGEDKKLICAYSYRVKNTSTPYDATQEHHRTVGISKSTDNGRTWTVTKTALDYPNFGGDPHHPLGNMDDPQVLSVDISESSTENVVCVVRAWDVASSNFAGEPQWKKRTRD